MKDHLFYRLALLLILAIISAGCRDTVEESQEDVEAGAETTAEQTQPMMGPGSGMMARHHAQIPSAYAGLANPAAADVASLGAGAEIFANQCATCHGETGMGDGPAGSVLDPQPAPLAHTVRMLGDDYLFWRISEGGSMAPFNSAMPVWKESLSEDERWDVINYLRLLSGGQPEPGPFDAQAEAEKRADMLDRALAESLISEEEAAIFDEVHGKMDALLVERGSGPGDMMAAGQSDLITELIEQGAITSEQAQAFNDIHDRLLAAGLMQ